MSAYIKLTYGQLLHFFKHFVTYLFESPLCDGDHNTIVKQGGKHTYKIYDPYCCKGFYKLCKNGAVRAEKRHDMIVNESLQKQRGYCPCN